MRVDPAVGALFGLGNMLPFSPSWPIPPGSSTLPSMPWDIRSEAAKERIIAFGIVFVLMLLVVLSVLAFFGTEFIENALR